MATFLKWLFTLGGGEFPSGPLQILPRTIVVVFVVGVVVTVVSALAPAFRASRISPLEALHDVGQQRRSMRFRIISGAMVLIPGLILLGLGLTGAGGTTTTVLSFLGFGSILTFVGVSMLSALFAGAVASTLGRPVEAMRGTVGRIARDNASRNPQRTAATATSLMIGLALITGVSVLASSIKATFSSLIEDAIAADLFIYEEAQGLPFSAVLADDLIALPEVDAAAGYLEMEAKIDGEVDNATSFDTNVGSSIINIDLIDGVSTVEDDGIAVVEGVADDLGLTVGSSVTVEFEDGFSEQLTVKGIFETNSLIEGAWILDRSLTRQHVNVDNVDFIGLTYNDAVPPDEARAAVETETAAFPQLTVQDNTEFQESVEGQINSLLLVINGLLGLCLVVAFVGIVNTMALSVLERTREIGLLRAVGMTRRQLKSSVRWEAVIVSLFGAFLGVAMGIVLAYAGMSAIPDDFITDVAIPWFSLVVYILAGGILGLLAAYFPARRAAKLNVLDAIASS